MAAFKEETDIEGKHRIFKLESSEFQQEFPDIKEFFKREKNETVNYKSNDFVAEHGKKSDNLECELFIKKRKDKSNRER